MQEDENDEGSDTPMDDSTSPLHDPAEPEPAPDKKEPQATNLDWTRHLAIARNVLRVEPRAAIGSIDQLLDWARRTFPVDLFDRVSDKLVEYGHIGIFAAQILTVLFGIAAAIKTGALIFIAYGFGLAVLLIVIQYTAHRFIDAGATLIKNSPSKLTSSAPLDCSALLLEVLGLIVMLTLVGTQGLTGLLVGLGIWALCDAVAFVALHPDMVNVELDHTINAGDEAVGIMSFLVKAVTRIVPAAFGIGAIVGSLALLAGTLALLGKASIVPGLSALKFLVLSACLPFAAYLIFVFYHLLLDLLRAVLSLTRSKQIEQPRARDIAPPAAPRGLGKLGIGDKE